MEECRLCKSKRMLKLIDFGNQPISHHLLKSPEQNIYKHPLSLYFCEICGFIELLNPIPAEKFYTNYYSLTSWKNQPHISHTIDMMEKLPGFDKNAKIIEVGSNDGIFLDALKNRGYFNFLGIEPAKDAYEAALKKDLKMIHTYFNRNTAREIVKKYGTFDFFINRQVIEHISDLNDFKDSMRMVLSDNAYVIFEIPDFLGNLKMFDYACWEEHINCFTMDSFKLYLESAGITVISSESIIFSGNSLIIIGKYSEKLVKLDSEKIYVKELRDVAMKYSSSWPIFKKEVVEYLYNYKKQNKKIAVYGAGARACCFINFTGISKYISFIVDDQKEKQGYHLPGSNLPIYPSKKLESENVDMCLLGVTTENEDKVMSKNKTFSEKGGKFYSILPPSERLLPVWNKLLKNPEKGKEVLK